MAQNRCLGLKNLKHSNGNFFGTVLQWFALKVAMHKVRLVVNQNQFHQNTIFQFRRYRVVVLVS